MTDDNGRAGGSSSQERLAELERSVASLQAELATLRGGPAVVAVDGRASGPGSALPLLPTLPVADLPDSRTTRRALLGRMGLLGAGTAAGVLVAGTTAVPAAALPVTPTPAPTPGWVRYTGAGPGPAFLFEAGDGTTEFDNPTEKAALAGAATGGAGFAPTIGVFGYSSGAGGVGVKAVAASLDGVGLVAQSDAGAAIRLASGMSAPAVVPPPTPQTWIAGDLLRSSDGHLWYCKDGGQGAQSRWSRLSGTGFEVLPVPARAYDSREEPDGPFTPGETRLVPLGAHVPARATAVLLNVTVADTTGAGYLQVYAADLVDPPSTSNLNWFARDQIVGNNTVSAMDGAQQVKVTVRVSSVSVIVDVFGYVA